MMTDETALSVARELLNSFRKPPSVQYGGKRAYYIPQYDVINMPEKRLLPDGIERTTMALHEYSHAVRSPMRLARFDENEPIANFNGNYTCEELIAELSTWMLANRIGLLRTDCDVSREYRKGWHDALRRNPLLAYNAANSADEVVAYFLGGKERSG